MTDTLITGNYRTYMNDVVILDRTLKTSIRNARECCSIQAILDAIQLHIRVDGANLATGQFEIVGENITSGKCQVVVEHNNVYLNGTLMNELKRYLMPPYPETSRDDIIVKLGYYTPSTNE